MSSRSRAAAREESARALEAPPPAFPTHTERASSPPSPAALAYLRGRDADGRMQALIAERAALRPVLGLLALRRLEDELSGRDTARDAITFNAPPEAANVFLLALEAARLQSKPRSRPGRAPRTRCSGCSTT